MIIFWGYLLFLVFLYPSQGFVSVGIVLE